MGDLDERSTLANSQKVEIVALKTQVEALKERLDGASNELQAVEDRRDAERVELKAATQELQDERGKVENLGRRVAELEQQLVAQTKEAEILGRRAQDLETRLGEQSRLLNQSEFELKHVRQEMDAARKVETELAHCDHRARGSRQFGDAKSQGPRIPSFRRRLAHTKEERDRFARELATMKRETEEAWASERVENALLRERINDVAAEVARLASALEGPNSPIESLLAAETSREQITSVPMSGGQPDLAASSATATLPIAFVRCRPMPPGWRRQRSERPATEGRGVGLRLTLSRRHSLYRASAMAGRLAQRESVPFTRERS